MMAQNAGAINQTVLPVEGVAIGIAQRDQLLFMSVQKDTINLVLNLVAYVEEAGLVPHRTFGETKIARNPRQHRVAVEQFPEFRRFGCEFGGSLRHARLD